MENKSNGALLVPDTEQGALSQKDIATLTKAGIVPAGTPFDQIMVFAQVCRERGLSPFTKEIYLVGYGGNYSVIVGINGFRRLACDTGQFAGCDDAKYDLQSDGSYKTASELVAENKLPVSATVTVYRAMGGQRVPFTHTAVFKEFSTGKQKWQSMPFQMIAKVAEAFALRKGFSDRLTGLSIPEELGAIEDEQANVQPEKPGQTMEELYKEIEGKLKHFESVEDLRSFYRTNPQWHTDKTITRIFTERSKELTDDPA